MAMLEKVALGVLVAVLGLGILAALSEVVALY